ncbi:MAG: class I SAM-dependent methyltransferase [Candidatus Roizmanbacteria bacterium]|nr:class I SAM-dependent methyltransferase [Candidatus Roizmanbacteria bacterium]
MSADTHEASPLVSSKFFPDGLHPVFYSLIRRSVAQQQELEDSLVFNEEGKCSVNEQLRFVLESLVADAAVEHCASIISTLREPTQKLRILDVGGGVGTFIQTLRFLLPQVEIDATILSLTDFFAKTGRKIPQGINLKIGSAELPSDDLYQSFDAVTQFSGPLQWSRTPHIVANNMIQMVRPGGFMFYHADPNYYGASYSVEHPRLGYGFPIVGPLREDKVPNVRYKYIEVN